MSTLTVLTEPRYWVCESCHRVTVTDTPGAKTCEHCLAPESALWPFFESGLATEWSEKLDADYGRQEVVA